MNSILASALAMLLMAGACNKGPAVQHLPDQQQTHQQTNSLADTSSWRTYANTKFGFEFRYPSHWREANTITDKANILWINFSASSAGAARNVLYVKVFPDRGAYSLEERLIAGNATATKLTVDNTTQNLYGDFLDIPTAMIAKDDLFVEIGDPSREGYLNQILATFKFSK